MFPLMTLINSLLHRHMAFINFVLNVWKNIFFSFLHYFIAQPVIQITFWDKKVRKKKSFGPKVMPFFSHTRKLRPNDAKNSVKAQNEVKGLLHSEFWRWCDEEKRSKNFLITPFRANTGRGMYSDWKLVVLHWVSGI